MVDPQIDAVQRKHHKLTFDPPPAPGSSSPPRAPGRCAARQGQIGTFGHNRKLRGWPSCAPRCCASWPRSTRSKCCPGTTGGSWHQKRKTRSPPTTASYLDRIAAAINAWTRTFDELRVLFDEPEFAGPLQLALLLLGLLPARRCPARQRRPAPAAAGPLCPRAPGQNAPSPSQQPAPLRPGPAGGA
jgi:hypothetical protein